MAQGRKTGGRKKGTPNKEKQALRELLAEHYPDYHPVLALAKIATNKRTGIDRRITCHREVAKYIEPQLKAIEHTTGDEDKGLTFVMNLTDTRKRSRTNGNGTEPTGTGSGNGKSRPRPSAGN